MRAAACSAASSLKRCSWSALSERKASRRARVFALSAGGEPEWSEKKEEDVVVGERGIARAAVDIVVGGGWEEDRGGP